ncbi:MAG: peptide chain release factor 1 [Deltaproteobacteria bacterium]|nr:peptide chain release factor 1 [Deltaproteobacteria bacterium]
MLHQLEDVEHRFEDLTARLSDPNLSRNIEELTKLSKERAKLEEVVRCFREYRKAAADLAEAKKLLEGGDAELREMAKAEVKELQPRLEALEAQLQHHLLPKDPLDEKNVVVEIRAGAGGDEAALFAGELFELYRRYAAGKGWRMEVMSASPGSVGGYKEIIATVEGSGVYSGLKWEGGVHRVQRVPQTEAQGRIHTSTVTVAVLPEPEEVDVEINANELRIDVFRAGGHGGQSVNTTDSAVRIVHLPTNTMVICQDEKSQHKNKAKAMKVLRARLYELERAKADEKLGNQRRSMVGTGERAEKIRTYNFPQDRVSDHRINLTLYNLPRIMGGDLDPLVTALRTHAQAEALKDSRKSPDDA